MPISTNFYLDEGQADAVQALDGTMYLTQQTLYLGGYYIGGIDQVYHTGLRFPVSGLSGATVTSAQIAFYANKRQAASFIGVAQAEKSETPPAMINTTGNLTNRSRTAAVPSCGSSQLGTWSNNTWHTFPTDPADLSLVEIIQEIIDQGWNPTHLLFIFTWQSGVGYRQFTAYEDNPSYAAWLHVEYTAGDQIVNVPVVTSGATLPVSLLAPGPVALNAATVVAPVSVPSSTTGQGVPATVVTSGASIPTSTITAGAASVQATTVVAEASVPVQSLVAGGGNQTIDAVTVLSGATVPVASVSGVTTLSAATVVAAASIPTAATAQVLSPPVVLCGAVVRPATPAIGPLDVSATVVSSGADVPIANLMRGPIAGTNYVQYGSIERDVDLSDFPAGTQFILGAALWTTYAGAPAVARLYCVTAGSEGAVTGSEATTTQLALDAWIESSGFALTGNKRYRVEFGGAEGGNFRCQGAILIPFW